MRKLSIVAVQDSVLDFDDYGVCVWLLFASQLDWELGDAQVMWLLQVSTSDGWRRCLLKGCSSPVCRFHSPVHATRLSTQRRG